MGFRIFANLVLAAVLAFGLAACGSGSGTKPLQSIVVSAPSATLAVGASEQMTATGYYGDANGLWTSYDVTAGVSRSSTNPAAATINSKGLATGVAPASTTIKAALDGVTSIYVITVK